MLRHPMSPPFRMAPCAIRWVIYLPNFGDNEAL